MKNRKFDLVAPAAVLIAAGLTTAPALAGAGGSNACGPFDVAEGEICGDDDNGGCNSDPISFGAGGCSVTIGGEAYAGTDKGAGRDTDWYAVDAIDTDGDGQVTIRSTLSSQFPGVNFIIDVGGGDCSVVGVIGEIGAANDCANIAPAQACVPPGTYVVFVATGNPDGSGIFEGIPCGSGDNEYTVLIECLNTGDDGNICPEIPATCGEGAGPCDSANGTPGCEDEECCTLVCEVDPFCCDTEWDDSCASIQLDVCPQPFDCTCTPAPGAPDNDCPSTPQAVSNGEEVAFDTTNAETNGPFQPECNSAMNDIIIHKDLYYLYQAVSADPITATTCLLAQFDTKIAAYDAGTDASFDCTEVLTNGFIACNEDCDDPDFFSSELNFVPEAGNYYLIRVGGYLGENGPGTLIVSQDALEPIDNDNCADRTEAVDGANEYNNIGANTDGVAHADCQFDGQTYQDVWFNYTASVTGTLTISTCGTADYDTDMAVYSGCDTADCPPGDDLLIACNDDGDGCAGFTSEMVIDITAGQCYKIRVGGWQEGDEGTGTLNLTAEGTGCPCVWDLDGDCDVDSGDLAVLLAAWGAPYGSADLANLLAEWNCEG